MEKDELRRKFILDEDEVKARLETLVSKAMKYCRVDNKGGIHFENRKLSGKDKLILTLVARAIASELDPKVSADVTITELARSSGMPVNQIRARCAEFISQNCAVSLRRGVFAVVFAKIEQILDSVKADL